MRTLLELIESWQPCSKYQDYLDSGALTPRSTPKDILYSRSIRLYDKEWFFANLLTTLGRYTPLYCVVMCERGKGKVVLGTGYKDLRYDYETFLAMLYECLEHVDIDVAI